MLVSVFMPIFLVHVHICSGSYFWEGSLDALVAFSRVAELLLGDIDASNKETEGPKTSKGIGWITACISVHPEILICAWVCSVPEAVPGQPCLKCTMSLGPKSWLRSRAHEICVLLAAGKRAPHL